MSAEGFEGGERKTRNEPSASLQARSIVISAEIRRKLIDIRKDVERGVEGELNGKKVVLAPRYDELLKLLGEAGEIISYQQDRIRELVNEKRRSNENAMRGREGRRY